MSRSANYAATGMRAAAAKKQSMDRSRGTSEVRKRPEREHLIEAHLTVKNVAAGDAELALDVERRQDVDMFYGARNPGAYSLTISNTRRAKGIRNSSQFPSRSVYGAY